MSTTSPTLFFLAFGFHAYSPARMIPRYEEACLCVARPSRLAPCLLELAKLRDMS